QPAGVVVDQGQAIDVPAVLEEAVQTPADQLHPPRQVAQKGMAVVGESRLVVRIHRAPPGPVRIMPSVRGAVSVLRLIPVANAAPRWRRPGRISPPPRPGAGVAATASAAAATARRRRPASRSAARPGPATGRRTPGPAHPGR